MKSPIYQLWNAGLGDHWASLCLLGRIGEAKKTAIRFHSAPEYHERHQQILDVLDIKTTMLIPEHDAPNTQLDGFDIWCAQYFPTRRVWKHQTIEPMVCYHFDGESSGMDKNPAAAEMMHILDWCARMKLEAVRLTGKLDIPHIVSLLSRCALFVGCDSGMSHIAHSVNCPSYILQYKLPVVTCHRHKPYVLCRGAGEFMGQATNWVRHLRFLGYAHQRISIDAP